MSKIPNLFELMEKNNVTQQKLSEAIGFSQGNISDWKSGRSSPSVEALVKIAEYFNVSVDYLLGYTPNKQRTNNSLERLLIFAEKLTDEQIDTIIAMGTAFLDTRK